MLKIEEAVGKAGFINVHMRISLEAACNVKTFLYQIAIFQNAHFKGTP